MTLRPLVALLLAAPGCSVEPKTGTWEFAPFVITNNTCGGDPAAAQPGQFSLTKTATGYTVQLAAEMEPHPYDCTLEAETLLCSRTIVTAVDSATGTYDELQEGEILASDHVEIVTHIDLSCTGNACGALEGFLGLQLPCEVDGVSSATWKSP
jgi:hypothetical protein